MDTNSACAAKCEERPDAPVTMFAWCAGCSKQERMLTPRQAAARCSVTPRTIYRWSSRGRIHHVRAEGGLLLICYASLFV